MRYLLLSFLLCFTLNQLNAQEITALVIDFQTKQPIPYATVQYAPNKGVITNDEGRFTLQARLQEEDSLTISSMGYGSVSLPIKELENGTIFLKPSNIELKDVFLTNKNLKGKEIIARVKENVHSNYNFNLTHKKFFFRESHVNNIKKIRPARG